MPFYGSLPFSPPVFTPPMSPVPAAKSAGAYGSAPSLRFEEGHNMAEPPHPVATAEVYANDVLRVGANPQDSQIEAEKWDVSASGNPVQGLAPKYPYFEALS